MKKIAFSGVMLIIAFLVSPTLVDSAPAGPPGGLDVNVVNTPLPVTATVSGNVNVVNTPLPVTVTNASIPAIPNIPFTITKFCTTVGNVCKADFDSLNVFPEGGYDMVVIQQVSFSIKSDVIDEQAFRVLLIGNFGGDQWQQQLVTTGGITSGSFQIAGETFDVTAYHDDLGAGPGLLEVLRGTTELNGDNGVATGGFHTLSGYYTIKAE